MNNLVLIVEDEKLIANLLAEYFRNDGYEVHCLLDGGNVVSWVKKNKPAIIILDVMLPIKDGMSLCQELRKLTNAVIMMLTAKTDELDRLLGLKLGADDYICKPFAPLEVVARAKAVLRRVNDVNLVKGDDFTLDSSSFEVQWKGYALKLSAIEFHLLNYMKNNHGRIFSRSQLMDVMYPDRRIVSERTVDSHIKKMRKKLENTFNNTDIIQSVYGVGYKFERPE